MENLNFLQNKIHRFIREPHTTQEHIEFLYHILTELLDSIEADHSKEDEKFKIEVKRW